MINIHYGKLITHFVLIFFCTLQVHAKNNISITDGYIKASIPGSDITAAYMSITNSNNKAITLQKITSPVSDSIEFHEHSMSNGMMKMRQVESILIKANNRVVLQPSGLHIMVFALKQQLSEQEVISLTLFFSNETKINIQLPVYRYIPATLQSDISQTAETSAL